MTTIRTAKPEEHAAIGQLMVKAYSGLEGFPSPTEMPGYYAILAQAGRLANLPGAEILVALDALGTLAGTVVYFSDMTHYGTPGLAIHQHRASGFRFLAVDADFQNKGMGRQLVEACIIKAKQTGKESLIIHTTAFMKSAQRLYSDLGFTRHEPFDFEQAGVSVMALVLSID
jgi:GNAT superfamily N-acetyltransferase